MKFAYRNRGFWCRGYYVDTVGKNTKAIKDSIDNQLKTDRKAIKSVFTTLETRLRVASNLVCGWQANKNALVRRL